MRRLRSSLKERSTSEGEWCDTSPTGPPGGKEDEDGGALPGVHEVHHGRRRARGGGVVASWGRGGGAVAGWGRGGRRQQGVEEEKGVVVVSQS